ncbi:hypothetical protein Gasu_60490 isoform 2 [Galdieria sulphuraria]|uniref:Uncharacterized protein n=1 Tax=Galdieria sulphuraria TaxID=130081 RepID=M2XSD4_GALSU|nr:hypothetical protein Gasu_60490 isoform 2 [Galdieria sulphuraria]EME26319.1 hypothetical protein isoform 2 [Galdieria sulphuraria]|eukprot:XP_005702839.1 hypothetical protein isoform 2 [Galdieria sulphuraria]
MRTEKKSSIHVARNIHLRGNEQEILDIIQKSGWMFGIVDHPVRQAQKCPVLPSFVPKASHISGFTADYNTITFHGNADNLKGHCPIHSKS